VVQVLYADPAWQFGDENTGGSFTSGAQNKYPTMKLSDIQRLPVQSVMDPQTSCCFLWTPTPLKFSHGGPTLHAWGYEYKTTIYWHKLYKGRRMGMGRYFRGCVEELLVGVRPGRTPFGCQLPNLIAVPVEEHSTKPEAFRNLIEAATGSPFKSKNLELFARREAIGWTSIGNAMDGLHIQTALRLLAHDVHDSNRR
jgi:N6-adenosine-specific RNA methylase IME4